MKEYVEFLVVQYPEIPSNLSVSDIRQEMNRKREESAAAQKRMYQKDSEEGMEMETETEQRKSGFFGKFLEKAYETFRDKTRDRLCAELQRMGIDVQMAERGKVEEDIECGINSKSLGMIDVTEGPIRWINVIRRTTGSPGGNDITYYTKYGVPDLQLDSDIQGVKIESKRKGDKWYWKGKDSGLGIINRLNGDITINSPLSKMKRKNITIRAYPIAEIKKKIYITYPEIGFWVISSKEPSNEPAEISEQSWECYQAIANHLLSK